MRAPCLPCRLVDTHGSSLVEFSLVGFMLLIIIFMVVEISRLVLVYTDVANAAREGARYASVHWSGSTSTSGVPCNPLPSTNTAQGVACGMLTAAPVNLANATVTVSTGSQVGEVTTVTVAYQYDAFTTYFPLNFTLRSQSAGVIVFVPPPTS